MNIKRIKDRSLEKSQEDGFYGSESDVSMVSDLLYELINHSYETSGTALTITINEHEENLQSLYWRCKESLEKVSAAGEKVDFLIMSILEDTWRKVKPLLLVRTEEMLEGDMAQIEKARKLQKLFEQNSYSRLWKEKAGSYVEILRSLGFDSSTEDFLDLTELTDPLLNAFTFYKSLRHVYQVKKGRTSNASPVLMQEVCIYNSFKEFADTLMSCEKDAVMAFGGIVLTEAQCDDYFYKWEHGYYCERHRNITRYENLSEEDYRNKVRSRSIWFAVRNGDNLWMYGMPYNCEGYKTSPDCQRDKFYYGKRAGYAPYEVFFKDMVIEDKDTTLLSIPRKGYRLSEFMDHQQMGWLPAFIEETVSYFFRNQPDCEYGFFPEERRVCVASYEIMPAGCSSLSTSTLVHQLQRPEEILTSDTERFWINYFHISREDLKDVPLLQGAHILTEKESKNKLDERVRRAYLKVIEAHLSDFIYESIWQIREDLVSYIRQDGSYIIGRAMKGKFDSFAVTTIDKRPVVDEYGNPKTTIHRGKEIPVRECTSSEDAKDHSSSTDRMGKSVLWNGERTAGKPPVVITLTPHTKADYAALLGCQDNELPELLRLADLIYSYGKEHNLSERDYGRNSKEKSPVMPCIAPINICMKKSTWKVQKK